MRLLTTFSRPRRTLTKIEPGLILACLLPIFVVYPLLRPGLPSIADAPIHLFRTVDFYEAWRDGVYFPRWAPNLAFGYGYPLFNFAPPLPYQVTAAFHLLGLSLETSLKAVVILTLLLYGLGMYLFVKDTLGPAAALLAATAYVYTPFLLRETLIYGGNYPQLLAIGTFPWLLWLFHKVIASGNGSAIIGAGLAYAALILSHNFQAMIFSPVLLLYAFMVVLLSGQRRRWKEVVLAVAIGLGLSAFFWLPAFVERLSVGTHEELYIARSDFRQRFLGMEQLLAPPSPLDRTAANPSMPFGLGPVPIILSAVAVIITAVGLWGSWCRRRSQRISTLSSAWHIAFFASLLALSIFFILPASLLIWENMPLLPLAQFPWRFFGLATLAVAFLSGAALQLLKEHGLIQKTTLTATVSILLILVSAWPYLYPPKPFIRYATPSMADLIRFESSTQTIGMTTLGEYLPMWVKARPYSSPMVARYMDSQQVLKLDVASLPSFVNWELLQHTAVVDAYRFDSPHPFRVQFNTFYFPGWRAYLDAKPSSLEVAYPYGLITIQIPSGQHEVALRFESTPLRTLADRLTLSTLALLLAALGWSRFIRKPKCFSPQPVSEVHGHLSASQGFGLGVMILILFGTKSLVIDRHTSWFRRVSPDRTVLTAQHSSRVNLEDKVLFLGYDISSDHLQPGDTLYLRLYWQALEPLGEDYAVFAHLDALSDSTTRALSTSRHPGDAVVQGEVPTSTWDTKHYVRDEHVIKIGADVPPAPYALRVGLFQWESGERLRVVKEDGRLGGSSIYLQDVYLSRRKPLAFRPWPRDRRFILGEQIELLGYQVESNTLAPGGELVLTLYWRTKVRLETDYTVFFHLMDEEGQIWGQKDGMPAEKRFPTSSWLPGQIVEDRRRIHLGSIVPSGTYRMAVGMYELATLRRLTALGPNGPVPENRIVLDLPIEVREP